MKSQRLHPYSLHTLDKAPAYDIFVSYNHGDQAVARRFVRAFEREGFRVWWDATIRSGEDFDHATEAALRSSKAVAVLWSPRSVVSRWVRAEAALALRNETFAPVMIEPCERPILFELVQTIDLSHWSGEPGDSAWLTYLADIRRLVEHEPNPVSPTAQNPLAQPARSLSPGPLPRAAAAPALPGNLPRQLTPLIGRQAAVTGIEELLIESPAVTLVGLGGVGKTRLSLEVGRRLASAAEDASTAAYLRHKFSAGVWFVELAALTDAGLIAATVAGALDIALADGAVPEQALARRLSRENLLIVLDNCEHLLQPAAAFCEYLLERCQGVQILASSHEPLRIQGESVFHVAPLALPDTGETDADEVLESPAVALFTARARAADSRFAVSDQDALTVATICRRLDGLPLAIEMAAARVATLGLDALAANLDERFRILTVGRRTALPRQQTLRATLDWSYGLLDEHQQSVLRKLGVFPGEFTLAAACAVAPADAADAASCADVVEHLAARSLLVADPAADTRYFRMLETPREYARAKLAEAQEDFAAGRHHAAFFRERLEKCYLESFVASDTALRRDYGRDLDNVRSAVDWAFGAGNDIVTGFAILGASEPLFLALAGIRECRARIESALPRLPELEPGPVHARLCQSLGRAYGFSNPAKAFEWLSKALPVYRNGDPAALGSLLVYMGRIAQVIAGKAEESERLLDEGGPLVEQSGLPRLKGHLYRGMANRFGNHGDFAASVAMMHRAIAAFRAGGADGAASTANTSLGYFVWASGDIDAAIVICREVLSGIRAFKFPDDSVLGFALGNLAGMLTERGDLSEAGACLLEAVPLLAEPWQIWVIFDHVALLAARSGELDVAAQALGFGAACYATHGAMRQPNEQRARTEAQRLAANVLGAAQVAALEAQGANLSRKAALEMAARIGETANRRASAKNNL